MTVNNIMLQSYITMAIWVALCINLAISIMVTNVSDYLGHNASSTSTAITSHHTTLCDGPLSITPSPMLQHIANERHNNKTVADVGEVLNMRLEKNLEILLLRNISTY